MAVFLLLQVLWLGGAEAQMPQQGTISPENWAAYTSRFLTSDGRVVDDANGGISHSESQGYGLLLAFLADDEAAFDQIWTFTKTNLWLRDDGLVVWKWDPRTTPRISDVNNASDGDLLIAYSLVLADRAWERPDLRAAAERITRAMERELFFEKDGAVLIRPAVDGFDGDDRPDGPVVNLSYWIFEALPVLGDLTGDGRWAELSKSGLRLVREARFGPDNLPSDWISVRAGLEPAAGFPPEFGYNAIRVPLYLLRAGHVSPALLLPFLDAMSAPDNRVPILNVETGEAKDRLTDPGYLVIGAALRCIFEGVPLDKALTTFRPTHYYPSTLHLLMLSYLAENHPRCR
ncbi:glycosyl hydrolase family 8 [Roseibium aquae]|uniref:glycosyl hydrolase family 8 n=1 Tax=Roseibium aquae TaxID=1323746 RepID=UPI003CC80B89